MEKVSHLIMEAISTNKWKALRTGKDGPWISHLMFAANLLLVGETKEEPMESLMKILKEFSDMSGKEVNKDKTCIMFSKNV